MVKIDKNAAKKMTFFSRVSINSLHVVDILDCPLLIQPVFNNRTNVAVPILAAVHKKSRPEAAFFLSQFLLQMLIDRVKELFRIEVVLPVFDLVAVDADGEVFGH